jgi:hypothetical protein
MKKLIPYLLLNFAVSALAMLLVLVVWNKTHPAPVLVPMVLPTPTLTASVVNNSLPLPLEKQSIEIQLVIGYGDVNNEQVQLANFPDLPVDLQGWKLQDEASNSFVFPLLTIFPGGIIYVHSMSGVNSSTDLFWGSSGSVWSQGEKVTLLDASGTLRASYVIP